MNLPDWINGSKNVLVAPLNWGLGHATRCIPIIQYLIENGKRVIIASDGGALQLLRQEFPTLIHHEIPGYNIHYKYKSMTLNIMLQSWKILICINSEKKAISKLIRKHNVDAIISDNRYGVIHKTCRNVIICHQVNILHPVRAYAKIASGINHRWINRFDECWIPDNPPPGNISGDLSNPSGIQQYFYIGSLSRFHTMDIPVKRDILVILSGPEPARTTLEKKLIQLLKGMDYMMVRGIHTSIKNENARIINYMNATELNEAICSSKLIICRSGYTSLMDLIKLKKQAMLIPTPGQVEQEYLAKVVDDKNASFQVVKESVLENELIPLLTHNRSERTNK